MDSSLGLAIQQYQRAYDKALELYGVFEDGSARELLRMQEALAEEITKFLSVSGIEWEQCGGLGRHLTFLRRNLKDDHKAGCAQDIRDIVCFDLPAVLRKLVAISVEEEHLDQRLKDGVLPLVHGGHFDSAVRKVFVVVTDRIRREFGAGDDLDGEDLINRVFGKDSKLAVADAKKQAMRNLLSGFYGVYRNPVAHRDLELDSSRARAILEMANTIISDLDALARESKKKTRKPKPVKKGKSGAKA